MHSKKNKMSTFFGFALILATVFALLMSVNVKAATITVPDDYLTIQQAINAASSGDIVYVRAGTYNEHITIGKSLTLQGEDRNNTIIDGGGTGKVVTVTSNYVTVSGLTIRNSGNSLTFPQDAGIVLLSVSNNMIADNNIYSNNGNGIDLGESNYNTITNNTIYENMDGIHLRNSSNNTITNNTSKLNYSNGFVLHTCNDNIITDNNSLGNNNDGFHFYKCNNNNVTNNIANSNNVSGIIFLFESNNNTIKNNIVSNNSDNGIALHHSSNYNTVINNTASYGYTGIALSNSNNNTITNNIASSYSENGISLQGNSYDNTITDNTAKSNRIGFGIGNSNNNKIIGNNVLDNELGIHLYSSNHNTITDNTASYNDIGIDLSNSNNNTITDNTASNNGNNGIDLRNSSNYNIVINNTASNNSDNGIALSNSNNNTITNNIIQENNDYDLWIRPETDEHCNNVIEDNIGSGNRPIKYLNHPTDLSDQVFSQLILCNADDSNINNVTIIGSETKRNNTLFVCRTENSNFTNINSSNNWIGIQFESSSNNDIIDISANNNSHGIGILGNSNNNTLTNSTVSLNEGYGIYLAESTNNNLIYHNDIISNGMQVFDYHPLNRWDNGYPSGGNYWSDYTGVDYYSGANQNQSGSDEIGDTPYDFVNNQDKYPRMKPCNILQVAIDIKPGSDPNSINPNSNGVIPVAILTTSTVQGELIDFDATTVDTSTVRFGPDEAPIAHNNGHIEDVDEDGDLDLLLHFKTQKTGIQCGDTEASLSGETYSGQKIAGTDAIQTVGCGNMKPGDLTPDDEITSLLPESFALYQNYPNPFNPSTTIQYDLPVAGFVTMKVFDMLGNEVALLVSEQKSPGSYEIKFNASGLPSGIYFYRLQAGDFVETRKMVLIK